MISCGISDVALLEILPGGRHGSVFQSNTRALDVRMGWRDVDAYLPWFRFGIMTKGFDFPANVHQEMLDTQIITEVIGDAINRVALGDGRDINPVPLEVDIKGTKVVMRKTKKGEPNHGQLFDRKVNQPLQYLHWAGIRIEPGCSYWKIWKHYRYLRDPNPPSDKILLKSISYWQRLKRQAKSLLSTWTERTEMFIHWLMSGKIFQD